MGQMVFEPLQAWQLGAHATPAQDLAPKGSFAVGENTMLLHNTGETAVIAQREGWMLQNPIPQPGSPAVIGQYDYVRSTGPLSGTSLHLVVGSNGRLDIFKADMTMVPADPGRPIPFTPGFYPPSFATMNNHCFMANGIDRMQVFNGVVSFEAGLVAPNAPTLASTGGALPAGPYSVLITRYEQFTGLESSASPEASITLSATGGITVSWVNAAAGGRPYTHTRIYIRQDTKQTEHFLVTEVALPATSVVVSLTQDQLDALTILAPDEDENDPPIPGLIGLAAHVSRLFAHDGSRVYYSNLDQPEAWDPDNSFSVNQDDGQKIIALHSAHEVLLVMKKDSIWALYGEDPATWVPRMISATTGCLNERSVIYVEGMSYWWSERGPMGWSGSGPVDNLSLGRLDDQVALEVGIATRYANPDPTINSVGIVGAVDIVNQRILWAIPGITATQNNFILPYKYRFNQWEATKWFGLDAASLATVQDASSAPYVFLGGYKGQIFRYGGVFNDGTPSGLLEGQVVSATLNTLTVDETIGPLLTDGAGLTERYLYVNDGTPAGWQIKRIGSNTSGVITLAAGEVFSNVPNTLWNWSVGTIGFRVVLPWSTFSTPFIKKRLEYGYFWVGATVNASELEVELYRNYDFESAVRYFKLDLKSEGLIWDQGQWDRAVWGSGRANTRARRRLAKVCFSYRWLLRQYKPNTDAILYKIDTRGETQVDKP